MKNKKAIVLLMASAIVLSLVGCAGSTSEAAEASSEIPLAEAISDEPVEAASIENSDSEASDSASAIDNSALQDDQFQYNGKIISVMDDLNALINAFDYSKPEPYDIQSFYTSKDHSVTLETLKKDEIEYCKTGKAFKELFILYHFIETEYPKKAKGYWRFCGF